MSRSWCSGALAALCAVLCLLTAADSPQARAKRPPRPAAAPAKLPRRAAVDAYILGPTTLIAGSRASYRVAVHWAASPRRQGPLPGARVSLRLRQGKRWRTLCAAFTARDGNARASFTVPRLATGPYHLAVQVDSTLGAATREHQVTIYSGGRLLLSTDKELYQPGQVIHIRALALRPMDLKPVAGTPIRLRVLDPRGNVVFNRTRRTSRFGIAALDFELGDSINLGRYQVSGASQGATRLAESTRQVQVKRYVLPKFAITLQTDRSYYQPGDRLRGTVSARYHFGKPVVGARVSLDVRSRLGRVTRYVLPRRTTDAQGQASFELRLAGDMGPDGGEVRVLATVVDSANQRQQRDLSLPLTTEPLGLELVTENPELVPGVANRVHVLAGMPDGRPARGARITLHAANGPPQRAVTDSLGVATFKLVPGGRQKGCADGLRLRLHARDKLGEQASREVCAPLAERSAVLVRPRRSLVAPGEQVELELLAAPRRGPLHGRVFVDVVKSGQTLATYSARLRGGRARLHFTPDAALFGLLELRGYRLKRGGKRAGVSRVVYVERPGRLRIAIRADRRIYRPGQRARLSFQVSDSRTGDGVQAALGVQGVDEAVVALGGLKPERSPKLFFTLASELYDGEVPQAAPGGRDLEQWIAAEEQPAARRRRAADVLLGALRPAEHDVWETNPWKERQQAWRELAPRLIRAALRHMERHPVGQHTRRGWRFHPQLIPRLARAGLIHTNDVQDPWRRVVRPWHLRRVDPSFVFSKHAPPLARRRLEAIYEVLHDQWEDLKLERERLRSLPRDRWPLVLPRDLLQRLVRQGKLKPWQVVDPWGRPFRVVYTRATFVDPYSTGLVSRYQIISRGPDGRSGTRDDLAPAGPRVRIKGLGPGKALGQRAERALAALLKRSIGSGVGLSGVGYGGGGSGAGTIGLGSMGTIGHGSGVGGMGLPARVRQSFPETLLWQPELVTDGRGRAELELPLADSITDWRIVATGSTTDGLLGRATHRLRVFQDFFVDVDLPANLTQGDRISVPVTVYNYLARAQRVTLRLEPSPWYRSTGPLQQTITLAPSAVQAAHFPIAVQRVGPQQLTLRARTHGGVADAVRRTTRVEPDGVQQAISHGGNLRPSGRPQAEHQFRIPDGAIAGGTRVQLAIYDSPMGQTLDGLQGLLRRPHGCFEQTSSTTYPNVLVLDYLRRTGKATPAVKRKARRLINLGYQRLIRFEVPGGGFSWFGRAPANQVLTAYGLMEFFDMARVHPVDPQLIQRTQRWLASRQRPDGSWAPDRGGINEGATNHFRSDVLRITAYLAHALRRTGYRGKALQRALGYVRAHADRAQDAYTLALLGNLLAHDAGTLPRGLRERLWAKRRPGKHGLIFPGPAATLTHGAGRSGETETTALAALALLEGRHLPPGSDRVIDTLLASKDSFGSWTSTQATILALRALIKHHELNGHAPRGEVQVLVDGRLHKRLRYEGGRRQTRRLDLTGELGHGQHRLALRFAGQGTLQYHLGGRYWVPRPRQQGAPKRRASPLTITTRYSAHRLAVGQNAWLKVEVRNRGQRPVEMPLLALSLPPTFEVADGALPRLAAHGSVDKVQRAGGQALLYLTQLAAGGTLGFTLRLRGKAPAQVQARPSAVYEYYRPENRAETPPQRLTVQ